VARDIHVASPAKRTVQNRVVQQLEEIGLALAVAAQKDRAVRRKSEVQVREIPEASRHDPFRPHG
jgi:hypothetical protein